MLLIYEWYMNTNCGEPHVGHWEVVSSMLIRE